jgi:AcrR family transcriptional regulator
MPIKGAPRPLRRDAELNRQRLLEAAGRLFAERGLDVSMDDIAHHAGVGVGTAYRRFASRDALVAALFEERIEQFVALAEEALDDEDPWRGLVGFLERSAAMQACDRGLKQLLLSSHLAHASERLAGVRRRVLPMLGELVRRAQAAGRLRADVSEMDLPFLNLMTSAVADYSGDVDPELYRRYLGILLDGLRAERDDAKPLAVDPLDMQEMDRAMAGFRPPRVR